MAADKILTVNIDTAVDIDIVYDQTLVINTSIMISQLISQAIVISQSLLNYKSDNVTANVEESTKFTEACIIYFQPDLNFHLYQRTVLSFLVQAWIIKARCYLPITLEHT